MRKALVLALLLTAGSAVLGATVLRAPIAQAAKPVTDVFVSNDASAPVPVREQGTPNVNVTNATLPVHEQGTASVNVTNSTVPVSGTVNVGNLPSAGMRVILVAQNVSIPKNTAWNTGYRDTSDCSALAAFIDPGELSLGDSDVFIRLSADGVHQSGSSTGVRPSGFSNVWYFSTSGGVAEFTPKAELVVENGDQDNARTLGNAWLVCQR